MKKLLIGMIAMSLLCSGCADYQSMYEESQKELAQKDAEILVLQSEIDTLKDFPYEEVHSSEVSFDDLYLLARLIHAEGSTESFETKVMIGSVVMNRVHSSSFPSTLEKVIFQKNQFEVTVTRKNGVLMIDEEPDTDSYRAAYVVLTHGSVLPSSVLVFYSIHCKEQWVNSRPVYDRRDNTVFAYLE